MGVGGGGVSAALSQYSLSTLSVLSQYSLSTLSVLSQYSLSGESEVATRRVCAGARIHTPVRRGTSTLQAHAACMHTTHALHMHMPTFGARQR